MRVHRWVAVALLGGVLTTACSSAPNEAATLPPAPTTTSASVTQAPSVEPTTPEPSPSGIPIPDSAPVGDDSDEAAIETAKVYARAVVDAGLSQDLTGLRQIVTDDCPCLDFVHRQIQAQKRDKVRIAGETVTSLDSAELVAREGNTARVVLNYAVPSYDVVVDGEVVETEPDMQGEVTLDLRFEGDGWRVFFVEAESDHA